MADVILRSEVAAAPPIAAVAKVDVSIVIVTWNSERWIDRCLQSIPAACEGLSHEIILHDNASSDATLAIASAHPDLHVIRSAHNSGFAAATNRGMAQARGRYVFLLNPDCELAPLAVTRLYQFLESQPAVAAAAPLLSDESGHLQREFQLRRLPTLATFLSELFLAARIFPANAATASYRYRDLDLTGPRPIEQPAAAALLLRREVVEGVGPFDEQFSPAWFEDVDYCQRLARAGMPAWVVPDAAARHFGGASLEVMRFSGFAEIWYRNMWLYAKKWMRPWQAEVVRGAIAAGMILRWAAAAFGITPRGVARDEALRAYRRVLKKAFARWETH